MRRRPTEVESSPDPSAVVGPRIRRLRHERGLTLQELGARTGLTHAFLSQVERGLARPSLRSTARIASALGVAIGTLVQPEGRAGLPRVTRASAAPAIGSYGQPNEATVRALTAQGHVLQGTLSEGHLPATPTAGHDGEELVHVLGGTLALTVSGERFVLERGDTIVFDGRDPHVYEGLGPEPPVLLIVVAASEKELPRDGPWPR
jgi:transcriptional regulator with XRE-family HTH domain